MSEATQALSNELRQARQARRLSQLELSLRLGISQRHLSFVESGRSKPSRDLLAAWLTELELPMVVFNQVMVQAGYAPVYTAGKLSDPALKEAELALETLLEAHDPMPAFVIDEDWNLVRFNRGARWLAEVLIPWLRGQWDATPKNFLDLLAHPEGFTKQVVNLHEVGPAALHLLRREAAVRPSLAAKVQTFGQLVEHRLGHAIPLSPGARLSAPVLTTRYATPDGELAFFSMFTTFGTPHDITLASLRVEQLFAADEATRRRVQREAA